LKVIGLVGKAGAGKDTVAGIIGRRYPSVRMGDVVVNETRRRGLPVTDENVGAVASALRLEEGMDAIAVRCMGEIESISSPVVVVNGIRGADEVRLFRFQFPKFILVEVWAPERLRYERIRARGRSDDIDNLEDFKSRDSRESSWGLDEAVAMADFRIENDGSLEELESRTWDVVEKIEASDP